MDSKTRVLSNLTSRTIVIIMPKVTLWILGMSMRRMMMKMVTRESTLTITKECKKLKMKQSLCSKSKCSIRLTTTQTIIVAESLTFSKTRLSVA